MKSSSEILMDFKKSVRYAEKLDRLAKGLREETGYYETLSFWEGEAASVWSGKTLALEKEIETGAEELEYAADSLRRAAERIYDAEMHAYNLARERRYYE